MIEQFGVGTIDDSYGINITFQVAFSNDKYNVNICGAYNSNPSGVTYGYKISTKLGTSCRIATNNNIPELSYLFIGY